MPVIFENTVIKGIPGIYPLTAENLMRVGLALCTLLIIDRDIEKPTLSIDKPDFITLSLSVGFLNAGGNVVVNSSGDIEVFCERDEEWTIKFKGISETDVKKLEAMLFGRNPIPKRTGKEIGKFVCQI